MSNISRPDMGDFICLSFGAMVGVLFIVWLMDMPTLNKAEKVIQQCESSIPRDKHCILIAVEEE